MDADVAREIEEAVQKSLAAAGVQLLVAPASLRDRAGMTHALEADVGCRNTVFHAASQSAAELVPRALAMRVGSLLINPRGLVGGELYLNELESLDGALKRRASPV